jgi:guanosine-3',5'-bis(diphosphate) 3'-pyrophosphohydrolase
MTLMNAAPLLLALDFAARKHRDQRRKDVDASPYINHPIAVATVLAVEGLIADGPLLVAAVLHDTIEDTETTSEELEQHFGAAVAALVREVTDDKTLPKSEQKRLQVLHVVTASSGAKQIKIADKICNVRDIASGPPMGWSRQQRLDYVAWSEQVVAGCRGVNPRLDAVFDACIAQAGAALRQT